MVKQFRRFWTGLVVLLSLTAVAAAQQAGAIRGMIHDKEFDVPLAGAQIVIVETGARVNTTDEGNFLFDNLLADNYTLIFSKEGYVRQVKADVQVSPGQMTELDIALSGEFTEMEDFIVKDVELGGATAEGLINQRVESPAMVNNIGAAEMKMAGISNVAQALNLVTGASVQDGKYAVIRGLPDRYVSSQMNGVRLPTADPNKRAVQLDQFPAAVVESIQVTKTFTPDQQGDASGGAVNVILKGIPDKTVFGFDSEAGFNTNVTGNKDFFGYKGDKLNFFGKKSQPIPNGPFGGAAGISPQDWPLDNKWALSFGGKRSLIDGIKVGGFSSLYYKRYSSFSEGFQDSYWVESPGDRMTPQYYQGAPDLGDFKTALFDIKQASKGVQWSWLGTVGVESEHHSLNMLFMHTQDAESTATLAEDTRGKSYYFPGYDPNNPHDPGNQIPTAAPYLRTETLQYTERATETVQFHGRHVAPTPDIGVRKLLVFHQPELDWTVANSYSSLKQPDKRQFGSQWWGSAANPGFPPWVPAFTTPATWLPFKPAANFTLGNMQRIWKDIREDSEQYFANLKLPFENWSGGDNPGYLKLGLFEDVVTRQYTQDSFSNFNDNAAQFQGSWEQYWSSSFPGESHPVTPADIDVDYTGKQTITAWYHMVDMPLTSFLNFIGGARYETTELSIVNDAEKDVTWIPPDALSQVTLNPGDADVMFKRFDVLPSAGFVLKPLKPLALRGSYSQTVARQTFKELTPIQQMEFLGGDVFIGNPKLDMSSLENYDLRLDYNPYPGGLVSVGYFDKKIKNPIEYVQRNAIFAYTTAVNYPEGRLSGYEFEVRQKLGQFWKKLDGLAVGANATFIDSEVTLPEEEAEGFSEPNIKAPMTRRAMTNAPKHLYNLNATYDLERTGTQLGLFYTVKGDTLLAGAGQSNGHFVPDVFELERGTLSLTVTQALSVKHEFWKCWRVKFQAKNLTDSPVKTVYRSQYLPSGDVSRSSFKKGVDFTISIGAEFNW